MLSQKLTCSICPNYFECPIKQYSLEQREASCVLMSDPPSYSAITYRSQNLIMIPETNEEWSDRLTGFLSTHTQ